MSSKSKSIAYLLCNHISTKDLRKCHKMRYPVVGSNPNTGIYFSTEAEIKAFIAARPTLHRFWKEKLEKVIKSKIYSNNYMYKTLTFYILRKQNLYV